MKGSQLMREAAKTASVFGAKDGVTVSFEGSVAMTNGTDIKLPMVDEAREFSLEERSVARGYLDHEAGHIKHTEMAVMGECKSDEEKGCLNFMEDARIERLVSEEYVGAAENLGVLNDVIGADSIKSMEGVPPEELGRSALYAAIFNEHHRRLGIGTKGCEQYLSALPEEVVEQAQPYVDELLECQSTRDVHEIVKRLVEVDVELPEDKEEEGEGDGEGDEEDSEEKGDGQDESEGDSEEGEGESKPSAEGTEDKEGETGEGEGERGEGGGKKEGKHELGRDPSKALSEMLGTPDGVKPKWRRYREDWDFEFGMKTIPSEAKDAQAGWEFFGSSIRDRLNCLKSDNSRVYTTDHQKIKGSIGKIKREIENKLLAKRDLRWESGQKKGRFDVKRCVAAFAGQENVFELRREDQTLDTVVTLMIDHSGSMHSDSKMKLSRLATICLSEVLSKVGVPFRVVGFDAAGSNKKDRYYGCGDYDGYQAFIKDFTDHTPVFHMVYKGFDESFSRSKSQIGAMSNDTIGSHNCDAASIHREWELIKGRHEEKKMIIVMSDGQPETDWGATVSDPEIHGRRVIYAATKAAIQTVVKEGGVISAIGIGSDAVTGLYEESVVINNFKDLPKVSLKMLEKGIFGGAA